MEALHEAVKAELGENGLPTSRGAEVPVAEHGYSWSVEPVKAEVKTEINVDLRETLVNVEIKSETSRPDSARAAVACGAGTAAHGLTEGVADEGDWRRVQPTRGAKRRAVAWAVVDYGSDTADEEWTSAAPRRRRRKVARVAQVAPRAAGQLGLPNLAPPEDEVVRRGEEGLPATTGVDTCRPNVTNGDAGWEAQLAKIQAYKRRHGDCIVSRGWTEDPRLGSWIHNQRECKKKLDRGDPRPKITAARVAKLEALGFLWEISAAEICKHKGKARRNDAGWEALLVKLRKYKRKHGDCNVPRSWSEDPRLGRWVMTQRNCKKKLDRGDPRPKITAARAAKLDKLGFAWMVSGAALIKQKGKARRDDVGWEAQLAKLKKYNGAHGDCNVPHSWVEDPALGSWVMCQRRGKRLLNRGELSKGMTAARVAKLEALGFAWELPAAGWEVQLTKLQAYKREHGDCNVPRDWAEDPVLGNWVTKQRALKKMLDRGEPRPYITAARVAELDKLDFAWCIYGMHA
jgi:hypothetical protein